MNIMKFQHDLSRLREDHYESRIAREVRVLSKRADVLAMKYRKVLGKNPPKLPPAQKNLAMTALVLAQHNGQMFMDIKEKKRKEKQ